MTTTTTNDGSRGWADEVRGDIAAARAAAAAAPMSDEDLAQLEGALARAGVVHLVAPPPADVDLVAGHLGAKVYSAALDCPGITLGRGRAARIYVSDEHPERERIIARELGHIVAIAAGLEDGDAVVTFNDRVRAERLASLMLGWA